MEGERIVARQAAERGRREEAFHAGLLLQSTVRLQASSAAFCARALQSAVGRAAGLVGENREERVEEIRDIRGARGEKRREGVDGRGMPDDGEKVSETEWHFRCKNF